MPLIGFADVSSATALTMQMAGKGVRVFWEGRTMSGSWFPFDGHWGWLART